MQLRSAASPNERGLTMRFKSAKTGPYQVLAVSGTNTISFAISAGKAGTKGLLGFAVERSDPEGKQDFYAFGFKVFPSRDPQARREDQGEDLAPSGAELRVGRLHRQARPQVRVRLPSAQGHAQEARPQRPSRWRSACRPSRCSRPSSTTSSSIAASPAARPTRASSATRSPSQLKGAKQAEAKEWLSRQLDDAILKFIADAASGDTLLCCFYEFRYQPVAEALKEARRSRRRRPADRRCQEQQAQGQERQGAGGFPARREPRHDREGGPAEGQRVPARGPDQRHPAQQVHGAAEGPAAKACRGVDRLDQHVRRRHPRPDQCRPLGARSRDGEEVPGLLGAAEGRPRRQGGRGPRDRQRRQQDAQDGGRADPGGRPPSWPKVKKGITPIFSPRSGSEVLDMYAAHGRRGRRHVLHHARLRHQQDLQGAAEGQQGRRPYRLLPAREGGQAQPARQGSVRRGSTPRTTSTRRSAPSSTSRSINGRRRPTRASCSSIPT